MAASTTTMAKQSLLDKILSARDIPEMDVEVPEWGVTLKLRGMSGAGSDEWRKEYTMTDEDGSPIILPNGRVQTIDDQMPARSFARVIVRCVVDDEGNLVFGPDNIEALAAKNRDVLARLSDICLGLSGMGAQAEKLSKNLPGQSVEPPSDSQPS